MAHFYGRIEGQAGEATRIGSRRSGYQAWAQNGIGRVSVYLWHNDAEATDYAEITIDASTRNYSGRTALRLPPLDLSALVRHSDDEDVGRYLEEAVQSLRWASERAHRLARGPAE